MQPKKTKRQTQGPTGLYELFLLTVPIEEVPRWQYIIAVNQVILIVKDFALIQFSDSSKIKL